MSNGTDKINGANELRNFANRFRAVLAIADDLERVGSLENGAASAEARLSAAQKQYDEAQAGIEQAKGSAAQIIEAAKVAADKIKDLAELECDGFAAAARTAAEAVTAEASRAVAALSNQRAQLAADVAARRSELAALDAGYAEAKARLDEVNKQLDAVRRKL